MKNYNVSTSTQDCWLVQKNFFYPYYECILKNNTLLLKRSAVKEILYLLIKFKREANQIIFKF